MCHWMLYALALAQVILPVLSQNLRTDMQQVEVNRCLGVTNCGKCIGAGSECAFCTDTEYDLTNTPRCDLLVTHQQKGCKGIVAPSSVFNTSSELTNIKNQSVTDAVGGKDAVQVQPQVLDLKIKTNDPQSFTLTYRLARNIPVDFYYLMDMSKSMLDDKTELTRLGVQMANELRNFTSDFRLGFGSFVDKVAMPFVSSAKNKINSPCPGCAPAYEFQNHLKLTADVQQFMDKLNEAQISGNLDAPEGGFDAILQAVNCDSQIGWRDNARRFILYSSDAGVHFAGDGKLGGIVVPNDGACHLNPAGRYTEGANQDYPSVSQVAHSVKDKNVNVIFAVTNEQLPVYQKLMAVFPGSEMGKLDSNSQNIVDLVRSSLMKITSKVEMIAVNAGDTIVKFRTKCQGTIEMEGNMCTGLQVGQSVQFTVTVEVPFCPENPTAGARSITIKPVGVSEGVTVNMDLICQCDCEKTASTVPAPYCSNQGSLVCGVCQCNNPYFGKTCNCSGVTAELEARCIKPGTSQKCSGRGTCECGSCICDARQSNSAQRYSGTYCECDNYNCPFYNSTICGGTDHGTCKCGTCQCNAAWSGDSCGCSTDISKCKANKGTGEICNGKGECVCGECKCSAGFYGPTCQDCSSCREVCMQQRPCVQCKVFGSDEYSAAECEDKCTNKIMTVAALPAGDKICEFKDSEDCLFSFSYSYDDANEMMVHAKEVKECPEPVNVAAIVGGVIGGIILIVLIGLIAWKVVIYFKDKRELNAFLLESQKAVWAKQDNPIYKKATRTYKNPTYGKRD